MNIAATAPSLSAARSASRSPLRTTRVAEATTAGTPAGVSGPPFSNAYLGYFVSERHNGHGYATTAVRQAVDFAFEELGLHRVQAAVVPRNAGSIRVLEKAAFREEGLALRYLQIAGVWEDHRVYAVTVEEWPGDG